MPRRLRFAGGGYAYHVLNRAVARDRIFAKSRDYEAFEEVLVEAKERISMRVLAWCVMPTHWHLALWPHEDGDLSEFMRWMTVTHTQRWHAAHRTAGTGPLYQGRFKSFPIEEDDHLWTVLRYVERNALRANLVQRAEEWRGPAFGDGSVATRQSSTRDRCPCRRTGYSTFSRWRPRRSWRHCGVRWSAEHRLARRPGKSARRNAWVWSPLYGPVADRESLLRHPKT